VWFLLVVVAGAAAVLSFDALRSLGLLCGFAPALAWLLPVVVDAGAAAGCLVWLGTRSSAEEDRDATRSSSAAEEVEERVARRFARALTVVLLASSVAGNAVVHGLAAYRLAAPWWLVVAVSATAPAVLGAVVHLAVLVAQGHSGPAESGVEGLDEAPRHEETPADWWTDAPVSVGPTSGLDPVTEGPVGPTDPDPVTELIEQGAGRRRLAKELGVSEHEARRLLAERTNGSVR
jgi:hypothetical protein